LKIKLLSKLFKLVDGADLGLAFIAIGCALVSVPLAFVVVGAILILAQRRLRSWF